MEDDWVSNIKTYCIIWVDIEGSNVFYWQEFFLHQSIDSSVLLLTYIVLESLARSQSKEKIPTVLLEPPRALSQTDKVPRDSGGSGETEERAYSPRNVCLGLAYLATFYSGVVN